MKRAALYAQAATVGHSIDNQLQELEAVARRQGWQVIGTFVDQGRIGTGNKEKPALSQLLNSVIRGEIDVVAAPSVEQLGRSLGKLVGHLGKLRSRNVGLYLHRQGLDTGTAEGRAMYQALDIFAEFERTIISERVKAGMSRVKAQGKRLTRPSLDSATIVRIRALRADGHSLRWIAEEVGVGRGTVEKYVKAVQLLTRREMEERL
jgi:DNA invertase Pin-like site-specific DNA recombinase